MPAVDTPEEYRKHLKRQGFHLEEVIGQGISGSVYGATQPSLGRRVAVKFFDSAFVRADAAARKRFDREARLLAKFQHQGVPYVLTEGVVHAAHGDTPYFVMEYVDGDSLRDILHSGTRPDIAKSLSYTRQVLDALGYAHARGIVHRDVKPANVMVDKRGRCFLIDFSIGVSTRPEPGLTRATLTKEMLGTTAYMAPEQFADSSKVDGRSDIFAMGAVLFEMLTGQVDRTNLSKALAQFPHSIVTCIETACAADADHRFQSADDFIRALGGTQQILAPILEPAFAMCGNPKCDGADWSENGYYRGPKVIEASSNSFCTDCGGALKYRCNQCGAPIADARHCGNCGNETYTVPTCKKCGSFLKKRDMGLDTIDGCTKCLAKEPAAKKVDDFDDDIPF